METVNQLFDRLRLARGDEGGRIAGIGEEDLGSEVDVDVEVGWDTAEEDDAERPSHSQSADPQGRRETERRPDGPKEECHDKEKTEPNAPGEGNGQ